MDAIIYLISYTIVVGIAALPLVLMFIVIRAILRAIKKQKKRKNIKTYNSPEEWKTEWSWDENRQLWIHKSELAKQIHFNRSEPTYEEWRKQRLKEQGSAGENTYHYSRKDIVDVKIEIPKNIIPNSEPKETTTATEPKYEPPRTNYVWESVKWTPRPSTESREYKPTQEKTTTTRQKYETQKTSAANPNVTSDNSKYKNGYEARAVLTKNEMRNYKTLYEAASRKGYIVNTKMRLADIVKPRNEPQYMSRFRKISQYHVDFVILDMNMRIKTVIELDDSSHDTPKRREHDQFIDEILNDCGIKIIRTRYIWPDILDNI